MGPVGLKVHLEILEEVKQNAKYKIKYASGSTGEIKIFYSLSDNIEATKELFEKNGHKVIAVKKLM